MNHDGCRTQLKIDREQSTACDGKLYVKFCEHSWQCQLGMCLALAWQYDVDQALLSFSPEEEISLRISAETSATYFLQKLRLYNNNNIYISSNEIGT